jgi:hypothetical protein
VGQAVHTEGSVLTDRCVVLVVWVHGGRRDEFSCDSSGILGRQKVGAAGHDDQAIDLLREGINRVGSEPAGVNLCQAAANLMAAAGHRDDAVKLLREGIARAGAEPGAANLYRTAARLMTVSGHEDEAIELLSSGRQIGLALPDRMQSADRESTHPE